MRLSLNFLMIVCLGLVICNKRLHNSHVNSRLIVKCAKLVLEKSGGERKKSENKFLEIIRPDLISKTTISRWMQLVVGLQVPYKI